MNVITTHNESSLILKNGINKIKLSQSGFYTLREMNRSLNKSLNQNEEESSIHGKPVKILGEFQPNSFKKLNKDQAIKSVLEDAAFSLRNNMLNSRRKRTRNLSQTNMNTSFSKNRYAKRMQSPMFSVKNLRGHSLSNIKRDSNNPFNFKNLSKQDFIEKEINQSRFNKNLKPTSFQVCQDSLNSFQPQSLYIKNQLSKVKSEIIKKKRLKKIRDNLDSSIQEVKSRNNIPKIDSTINYLYKKGRSKLRSKNLNGIGLVTSPVMQKNKDYLEEARKIDNLKKLQESNIEYQRNYQKRRGMVNSIARMYHQQRNITPDVGDMLRVQNNLNDKIKTLLKKDTRRRRGQNSFRLSGDTNLSRGRLEDVMRTTRRMNFREKQRWNLKAQEQF